MATKYQPALLIVLDGWGYSEEPDNNAIFQAATPNWDRFWQQYPHTLIQASGSDVGLPDAQMGNSEVGHMHLGAGRAVTQDYTRIGNSIADGSFFANATLVQAFEHAEEKQTAVHLFGLLSPGGVHSHEDHILATMQLAARCGVKKLYVHGFLDGRDTPPRRADGSIRRVDEECARLGTGRIASIIGRYYAMDRNKNWDRTAIAYEALVSGAAPFTAKDGSAALAAAYERGESDEFVQATAVSPTGERLGIQDDDVVVFLNFRADRARQLTRAFVGDDFHSFSRSTVPRLHSYVTLTQYQADLDVPTVFPPERIENTFGEHVAQTGLSQLRIAETEKYAHVTFFFNGGEEQVFTGEERILVPSPDVPTYDLQPKMSALEVTDRLIEAIESERFDAIICNFANPDMVGHTGKLEAAVQAVETIDTCLGRVEQAANRHGVQIIITADHGNAEQMRGAGGQAHTAHTSNPVPLIFIGVPAQLATGGTLSDVAPSLLAAMGLQQPIEMTGESLLRFDSLSKPAAGPR